MSYDDEYSDGDFIEPAEAPARSKWFLTVSVLLFALVGTTFSANISIGTGAVTEFGQGILVTAPCSGNTVLTIKPDVNFVNTSGSGSYYFSGYTISNIPSSCYGVDFLLNVYSDTSAVTLPIFNTNSTNSIVYNNNGTYALNGAIIAGQSITTNSPSSYTVTFTSPVTVSGKVYKITLQSGPHREYCATGGSCNVGDIGPGGGVIFYYSAVGFTETGTACSTNCHYLEAAPETWYSASGDPVQTWWLSGDFTFNPNDQPLGFGFINTDTILLRRTGLVDGVASSRDYQGGGKTDWFLPSIGELQLLYANKAIVGGIQNAEYWSSSQNQWYLARFIDMGSGTVASIHRYNSKRIRPIRAF